MRDTHLFMVVIGGLLLWLSVCLYQFVLWLCTRNERHLAEYRYPELMECPNCKAIDLPVEGGDCGHCHMPTYF